MKHISKTHGALFGLFVLATLFTGACGDDVEEPPGNGRAGAGGSAGSAGAEAGQAGEESLGGAGGAVEPGAAGSSGQTGAGSAGEAGSAGDSGAGGGGTLAPPGPDIPTYANCFSGTPTTHEEIINACTDAERVDKNPDLPVLPQN